ncbi:MAG TPA: TetR/AcrR family transcriptional regulator [Solirubrobacteraceae bacterium]
MEATAHQQRAIEGEKAQRIVEAMRSSVARRGVAGSTFDHVAREAGVSRGLLHYYFGTKERLLAEVVRRDCELRMVALDEQLAGAHDADGVIDALLQSLRRFVRDEPEFLTVVFELFTLSRRNDEIAVEFAALLRRMREHVAALLARKQVEGALRLRAEPGAVADVLFSLADGVSMRMLTETEHDFAETIAAGVLAVRALMD